MIDRYLDLLYGAEPEGSLVELRARRPGGMAQEFFPVRDRRAVAERVAALGRRVDVYLGVAPRVRPQGTRDAVERTHVLWADCDHEPAMRALDRFEPAPSLVTRSGSGWHAYWPLWPPAPAADAEGANRRLAHALGADMRATDAARILRPPGTFNYKTGRPVPVTVERLEAAVYAVDEVVGHLADREPARVRPVEPRTGRGDDSLLRLPPPLYVEALTGRQVGRDGKVSCPLHDDRTPSLHAYDSPERGWACFGCGRGGTVYDLAAALWGIEPRGAGFHELRRRIGAELRTVAA